MVINSGELNKLWEVSRQITHMAESRKNPIHCTKYHFRTIFEH